MSNETIIRAWKDEEFLKSLSQAELALLPENPAGLFELSDEELENALGGARNSICWIASCNNPKPEPVPPPTTVN